MTKIVHATSRGQVTLPKNWRDQAGTNYFEITVQGADLIIRPLPSQNGLNEKVEKAWGEYLREETVDHAALKKKYKL